MLLISYLVELFTATVHLLLPWHVTFAYLRSARSTAQQQTLNHMNFLRSTQELKKCVSQATAAAGSKANQIKCLYLDI